MSAPKRPVSHRQPVPAQRLRHGVDEGFGDGPGGGRVPGGAPALAGVGVEGELADQQHGRADVDGGQLPAQDPQLGDLAGDELDLGGAVVVGDAEQDEQAGALEGADDLAVDGDDGPGDALDDGPHGWSSSAPSGWTGRDDPVGHRLNLTRREGCDLRSARCSTR